MRPPLILLIGLISMLTLSCQYETAKNDELFDGTRVHRVEIEIDTSDLSLIVGRADSTIIKPAVFTIHYENRINTVQNVGFRIKGNTSRFADKKSFRISFNAYEKGKKYKTLEKLNLNAFWNDPTHLRSHLAIKLYELMDVAVGRSGFTDLYVNGEYYGLYNLGEHVDEEFALNYFDSKTGNLYKCLSPASLEYLGDDIANYSKFDDSTSYIYDLKINKEQADYSGLIELMDILNNTPIDQLKVKLEARFNVANYLKILAVDVAIGNWDSYLYTANNYYLYDDPKTGKFEFIPYDFDNTFGMDWLGVDWTDRDIYNWPKKESLNLQADSIIKLPEKIQLEIKSFADFWMADTIRPLYYRLLEVPSYRSQFNEHLVYVFDHLTSDEFNSEIDRLFVMLGPSLKKDTSDNFTWKQVSRSIDQPLDVYKNMFFRKQYYLPYGIKDYIQLASSKMTPQIEDN